ncbi:MAG TPA: hypothetical protein PKZ41_05180, partial [Candidatus Omnitrophota bacterium]|nr:hypothetical protein [Candidatus Omnitrophota bacterium]
ITMKGGFLYGDYSDQFYPWSMIYAGNIKNLVLPFWTRYVQSGFPVMAEGQIGGFYPPHMIFYFLFPFRFAYNYLTVIHFALAGIFTYIYTKKMGGCEWGSALAAFIFCFGGAYAGCMINTATLKALTWLPLVLFLYEKYFESRKPAILAFAGVATGLQLLSGAPQAALYSAFLCLVYFLTGLGVRSKVRFSDIAWMSMTMAIAAGIFLPQFVLTKVLAGLSWRSGANLDFALSGSFSPLAFISVVFPYPVPGGARVYIGLLSVLFLMAAVRQNLKTRTIYPIFAVLAVSVFVALGKYNPLFAAMIRFFRIYDFRGPSKAILFTIFSMSVLSGIGFTVFFEKGKDRQFYLRIFSGFLSFMLVVFLASKAVLVIFKDRIISLGEYLVTRDIYGQPFHRHDLSIYLKKVKGFYDSMVASSSFSLWPNLFSVLLCAGLIAVCFYVLTGKKKIIVFTRSAAAALIFIDLAVFSSYGTGFRGNIRNFDFVDPAYSEIFKVINKDKTLFRIFPYNVASAKLPNWTVPSLNSIYGIDSIALYTPLANE